MLSKLSLTFYVEFLRESLHKINSADLTVIKIILDVPEMSTMCGLAFFPLPFCELNSMEILREKSQLPIPPFFH